jgi:hypothetical protein
VKVDFDLGVLGPGLHLETVICYFGRIQLDGEADLFERCNRKGSTSSDLCVGFLGAFAKFRKAAISFVMSVRLSARKNSDPTGGIWYSSIFSKICREKFKIHYNITRITSTLHEDLRTFMIISH